MATPKLKTVVVKQPGQPAQAMQVAAIDMEFLQAQVGGNFDRVAVSGSALFMWFNEHIYDGQPERVGPTVVVGSTFIFGTIVVTGGDTPSGDTRGLTPLQAEQAMYFCGKSAV